MRDRAARAAWSGAYLIVALAPLGLMLFVGRVGDLDIGSELSRGTGLVGLSLLVVALVLPARVPSISSSFGIEVVLRSHRFIAMFAVAFIVAHLLLVFVSDERGLGILDLRSATTPVWAAVTSTVALGVMVALALRRRRRQPRYEGWRLAHVALAALVIVTAGLHVWLLRNLVENPLMRAWFLLLAAVVLLVAGRRWVWRPLRAHRRTYVVDEVRHTAGNAVVVRAHGHAGLPFRAGQFAWLKIGSSPFVFEEHPFTIASTAEQPHRKEFTIKAWATSASCWRPPPGSPGVPRRSLRRVHHRRVPLVGLRPRGRGRRDHTDAKHPAHPRRQGGHRAPPPARRRPHRGRPDREAGDPRAPAAPGPQRHRDSRAATGRPLDGRGGPHRLGTAGPAHPTRRPTARLLRVRPATDGDRGRQAAARAWRSGPILSIRNSSR